MEVHSLVGQIPLCMLAFSSHPCWLGSCCECKTTSSQLAGGGPPSPFQITWTRPCRTATSAFLLLSKLCGQEGERESLSWLSSSPSHVVQSSSMAAVLGFKSWCGSSSVSPFPPPPTKGYTCFGFFCSSWLPLLVQASSGWGTASWLYHGLE